MNAITDKRWDKKPSAAKAFARAGLAKEDFVIVQIDGLWAIAEIEKEETKLEPIMEAAIADAGQGFEPSGDMLAREAAERVARLEASAKNKPLKIKPIPQAPTLSPAEALKALNATGGLPQAPDFSKPSHAPYRKRLAAMVAMAEAGDIAGLEALTFKVERSSQKIMDRYRNAAVAFLKARG